MPLAAGTSLGPYEVLSPLGAGGMGEVYRAHDSRLNRVVALKLLPDSFASDPDRLRRFELEAQTVGALNHPNILVVHDVGVDMGRPYLICELLEGESLRERLATGRLPLHKAIDYARQAATGLAAAQARGIVHRDIKPDNLFVTNDGRLKILDFGLAKLAVKAAAQQTATLTVATEPGRVLGTVGYMAPEQVRGKEVDSRADIFSLGCVLFEMVTGVRAFSRESSADTMSAILTKDPLESLPPDAALPPALERTIRHCLEKNLEERFQSARDLAFDLEALSATSSSAPIRATSTTSSAALPPPPSRVSKRWILVGAVCMALAAGSFFLGRAMHGRVSEPRFERLTFRRGIVQDARFVPGNSMVVYAASWDGRPIELFSTIPGGKDSRHLGTPPGGILSVASNGDLFVLLGARFAGSFRMTGTLARAPLLGGVPREIREDVNFADYSSATRQLAIAPAVARTSAGTLEYPPGKVLWRGKATAWPSHIRISPKGDLVAFVDHYNFGDDGSVAVVDSSGKEKLLTARFASLEGLAWSPSGDEIWFTGAAHGSGRAIYAVTLGGRQRLVSSSPGNMTLLDIARDGRVLLSRDDFRSSVDFASGVDAEVTDLAWMDWSVPLFLSADGKTVVLDESGEGSHGVTSIFLRNTDGSPAVHIGDREGGPLSPDGKWMISHVDSENSEDIRLLPARAGSERVLNRGGLEHIGNFAWMPDSRRFVFNGAEKDRPRRVYIGSIDAGAPRPVTSENETLVLLLHNGSALLTARGDDYFLHPVDGGEPRVLPWKPDPAELLFQTTSDDRWVYVQKREGLAISVFRVELNTGKRELWRAIKPSNPVGVRDVGPVLLTPDGKTYALRVSRDAGDLYLAEGLR